MFKRLHDFYNASTQTKLFIFNYALYMFLIVVTTVYVYARLDFVRSGPKPSQETQQISS